MGADDSVVTVAGSAARRRAAIIAAGVAIVVLPGLAFVRSAPAAASSTPALRFGHEVVVDHQRLAGEPSISVSPLKNSGGFHDIYISAPYGFSTTASYLWKSEDGGQTFHLIGGQEPPAGKPNTCVGGGDSANVNDNMGNLYFADLQGLTEVSASVSTDAGNTFTSTCFAAHAPATVDRPWISVYKDPLTTGREYLTVDQVESCTVNCGLGQAGSNLVELTQTSGTAASAQAFTPVPAQQIEPDGIISGTVVNQKNGDLYLVHTALTDGSGNLTGGGDANGNDNAIVVDRFPGGFSESTATPIPPTSVSLCAPYNTASPAVCDAYTAFHAPVDSSGNSTVNVGQDFSPMAIDKAGNLYIAWTQAPVDSSGTIDGPSTIYMATSTNQGQTWSAPIPVSTQISGLQTNLFPSLAAGSNGRVDVVWYGSTTLGSCPSQPCGASAINGSWNVYMAQTINAVTIGGSPNPTPTFSTTQVTEFPNHYGAICTFGISCTTGGDRGLLDFISVTADPSGAADVTWADSANTDYQNTSSTLAEPESSAVVVFAKQNGGPGLYGGTVSGPKLSGSAGGSPDSYFAGNGAETAAPANSNVDIVSSSVSADPGNDPDHDNDHFLKVTMRVSSLSSLAVPSMGTDTDQDLIWLTRWELPTATPSSTDQGHFFFAAMESDGGAAPTFYDGESTCGIYTDHCKVINYAPQNTVTGSFTTGGLITILVPVTDVLQKGGDAKLYSVTGLTATEATPASTGTSIFNVIELHTLVRRQAAVAASATVRPR